jgi:hypothetical protein
VITDRVASNVVNQRPGRGPVAPFPDLEAAGVTGRARTPTLAKSGGSRAAAFGGTSLGRCAWSPVVTQRP